MNVRKIMCAVDFSPGSQQALRMATRLASENDAELVLFHAWWIPALAFPTHADPGPGDQRRRESEPR